MPKRARPFLASVIFLALVSGLSHATLGARQPVRELTILYTNDFHSAFDPIPAYWHRLAELKIGAESADDTRIYRVATNSFLAQGGDLYQTFLQTKQKDTGTALSDLVIEYIRKRGSIARPDLGRLVPVAANSAQKRDAREKGLR